MSANAIFLQRFVPHYRLAFCRALYESFGCVTVCSEAGGSSQGLEVADAAPFIHTVRMKLSRDGKRVYVPLGSVFEALQPELVIAEFSSHISWVYEAAIRRRLGRMHPAWAYYTHGLSGAEQQDRSARGRLRRGLKLALLKAADSRICYTPGRADGLRQLLPGSEIRSVKNTIDVETIRRSRLPYRRSDSLELIVANRLIPNKRVDVAIDVATTLASAFENVRLTIVGDGPDRGRLQALARGAKADVSFVGAITDVEALAPLFARSDYALIPGSAGLFVNQSLAFGVPVVMFDVLTGLSEHHPEEEYVVHGRTGLRIPDCSAEAMAKAIYNDIVHGDREGRHRPLQASIDDYVESNLLIDNMVAGFRELYVACSR